MQHLKMLRLILSLKMTIMGIVMNITVGGLEPWNFMTFHILGISSSQLTNSMIFQRGRSTTNQISN